ncbi:MAG: hypothetical protein AB1503_07275 [Bacillota bacterium]
MGALGLFVVVGVAAIALTVYWVLLAERATRALERSAAALERAAAALEQGGPPPGPFPHP